MGIPKHLRGALWAGVIGIALGIVLVVLYRFTQSSMIYRVLLSADRLAIVVATSATSFVFPGDRISYSAISAATFFDIVLVLVTGLQAGLLGALVCYVLNRRSTA